VRQLARRPRRAGWGSAPETPFCSSPEVQPSIPGALKNAIDWASRPWGKNSFDHMPAAVVYETRVFLRGGAPKDSRYVTGWWLRIETLLKALIIEAA